MRMITKTNRAMPIFAAALLALCCLPCGVLADESYAGKAVIRVDWGDRDQNLWPVRVQSVDGNESATYRHQRVLALEPGEHTLSLYVEVDRNFIGGLWRASPADSEQTVTYNFEADMVYVVTAHMERKQRDMQIVVIEAGSVGEAGQ